MTAAQRQAMARALADRYQRLLTAPPRWPPRNRRRNAAHALITRQAKHNKIHKGRG